MSAFVFSQSSFPLRLSALVVAVVMVPAAVPPVLEAAEPGDVLVTVDGRPITRADLEFEFVTNGVPEDRWPEVERRYLEGLVEARLLAGFLQKRKIVADEELLDEQVTRIRRMIARRDMDPDAVLKRVGYDEASLRRKLQLPIAWESYVQQVVRPADVRKYWEKHHRRFDGTRLRARQILLRLPPDADAATVEAATARLKALRNDVLAGTIEFPAAAREHSQAPSSRNGGDVGWFPYRGKMPVSFTEPVFGVSSGEMTEPFHSRFGVHLVQVTEVQPGEYSLEDVRTQVFDALADEVRSGLIAGERKAATVEWSE